MPYVSRGGRRAALGRRLVACPSHRATGKAVTRPRRVFPQCTRPAYSNFAVRSVGGRVRGGCPACIGGLDPDAKPASRCNGRKCGDEEHRFVAERRTTL